VPRGVTDLVAERDTSSLLPSDQLSLPWRVQNEQTALFTGWTKGAVDIRLGIGLLRDNRN